MLQKPLSISRRKHDVQRQLTLWPEAERNIWEEFDPETQKRVIALLSRLIEKAIRPHNETQRMRQNNDDTERD